MVLDESQEIIKMNIIKPEENMNMCTQWHGNPPMIHLVISLKTTNVKVMLELQENSNN